MTSGTYPDQVVVQIYGVTAVADAEMLASLGVDNIGVHVESDFGAFDEIDVGAARTIGQSIRGRTRFVVLSLSSEIDELAELVTAVEPDILHIGAAPQTFGIASLERLRDRAPSTELMRSIPVSGPSALQEIRDLAPLADYLLLDTKIGDQLGATGRTHDWSLSARLVKESNTPIIFAGGLSPDNVAEAIRIVRPWGVDSNSLTNAEHDARRKDEAKVRAFVSAARQMPEP